MAKGLGLIKGHGKRIGIDEILKQNERENLKNSNRSIKFFKIIRRYYHISRSAKRILKKRTQKCEVQVIEKKFIKKQGVIGLLNQIGIRTPLSKIPLLGDILFYMYQNEQPN